ncbi:MAG TPA: RNA polymerase sigma factor [Pirellulales bacterium]|nr:RNA polymerase sigma factor [Pirellulales bacterium]
MVSDHAPALYRLAFRLVGDAHEAEDVVQDTFRSAWKGWARFDPHRGGRAWLAAILRRRVADRRRRRPPPRLLDVEAELDMGVAAADPLFDQYSDEMQQALDRLPPALRETLLLVVVGELTHQEAADVLGVPLGTVLSRVSRARERLREYWLAEQKRH